MAIYVYNTKQQALNSKKIAELISFTSNDFGGLISNIEEPIIFSEDDDPKWYWNALMQNTVAQFIGGGVDVEYDVPQQGYEGYPKSFSPGINMWGLDVTVPSADSTIKTNNYTAASIVQVSCSSIEIDNLYVVINYPSGSPVENGYFEYDSSTEKYSASTDTNVEPGKEYYYEIANEAFKVTGAQFSNHDPIPFEYYGNTVWVDENRFFIPFCFIDSNRMPHSMIFNRDKTGYESFLSARTYYHLLNEIGNHFVFRIGGPVKGDIGDLNITDNILKNKVNENNGVVIKRPILDIDTATDPDDLNHVLLRNEISGKIYKTDSAYIIPIRHGGTSASSVEVARTNLGFNYGINDPSGEPTKVDTGAVDEGAVYFKLL